MRNNDEHVHCGACPKCGGEMLGYEPVERKLGSETFFFSDLNRLASGSLTVTIHRCRSCGYSEFYIPDEDELE